MNQGIKKKGISLDYLLVAVSISIATTLFIFLFKYDKWYLEPRIRNQETRESVGPVTLSNGNPKRRYAGSFSFFDLKISELIHFGDTLFIDNNSKLEFTLATGSVIRLGAMTLVLIDKENNELKIIINNGDLEAILEADQKVIVDINEEPLEIQGEKNTEFKISKSDVAQSALTAIKGKVKLKYKGQSYEISNSKFNLKENSKDLTHNSNPTITPVPKEELKPKAQAIANEPVSLDDLPIDIPIPYPPNKQLYLIKKQAPILILPKRLCSSDCTVTLMKDGNQVGIWKFPKEHAPLIKLLFTQNDLGHYTMRVSDPTDVETEFDVRSFSSQIFEDAIKSGTSVELLD